MSNPAQMLSRQKTTTKDNKKSELEEKSIPAEELGTSQIMKQESTSRAETATTTIATAQNPKDDEARRSSAGDQRKLIDETMRRIIEAHMNTTNYTSASVQAGFTLYEAIAKGQDDLTCEVSEMLKLSKTPEPANIWSMFVENMSATIKRVVAFVKLLPGYPDLIKEDKLCLFKHGSFEVILARYARLFTEKGMFVPDMTVRIPRHLVRHMPLGEFFEEQYSFADVFNQLNLNDEETGVVTGIMIMNESRMGLCNREVVRSWRQLYLQCLFTMLKRNHPETCEDLFNGILTIFPLCAKVNEMHARVIGDIKKNNPEVQFPEIHNLVF